MTSTASAFIDALKALKGKAPTGFEWLSSVADKMGKARFPDEWSSTDLTLATSMPIVIDPSPSRRLDESYDALGERAAADQVLRRHDHPRPEYGANAFVLRTVRQDTNAADYECLAFTEAEWAIAADLLKAEQTRAFLSFGRATAVHGLIAHAAESRVVTIHYRHKDGGETLDTKPHWWSTPHLHARFEAFTIDPDNLFSSQKPTGDGRHDLFVTPADAAILVELAQGGTPEESSSLDSSAVTASEGSPPDDSAHLLEEGQNGKAAKPVFKADVDALIKQCVEEKMGEARTRKLVATEFPQVRFVRSSMRPRYAAEWKRQYGEPPSRGANPRN